MINKLLFILLKSIRNFLKAIYRFITTCNKIAFEKLIIVYFFLELKFKTYNLTKISVKFYCCWTKITLLSHKVSSLQTDLSRNVFVTHWFTLLTLNVTFLRVRTVNKNNNSDIAYRSIFDQSKEEQKKLGNAEKSHDAQLADQLEYLQNKIKQWKYRSLSIINPTKQTKSTHRSSWVLQRNIKVRIVLLQSYFSVILD